MKIQFDKTRLVQLNKRITGNVRQKNQLSSLLSRVQIPLYSSLRMRINYSNTKIINSLINKFFSTL